MNKVRRDTSSEISISVIVPIYNEIELCEKSLKEVHHFLTENFCVFEIIVVESGSNDGSAEKCDQLAAELSFLRVFHESTRNGMGAALQLGYGVAVNEFILLVTADMAFPLATLLEAMPLAADYDCILSYRATDDRGVARLVQSLAYALVVRTLLGLPMKSVNSAFKLMRREFVQSLPLISQGWFLDAEILYWIARKDVRYVEIPVALTDRTAGQSKVTIWDWLQTLRELVKFRRELQRLPVDVKGIDSQMSRKVP